MSDWIDLPVVGRILVGALLLGAGLPAVFALGLRAVALGSGTPTGSGRHRPAGWPWLLLAGTCFVVVVAAAATGIVFIVRG